MGADRTGHKSLFAAFSSEKEAGFFFEKKSQTHFFVCRGAGSAFAAKKVVWSACLGAVMRYFCIALTALVLGAAALTPGALPPPAYQAMARNILAQLVAIDSTHAQGSLTAARAVAQRAIAAGFAPADVTLVAPPDHPTKGNVVIRLHGKGFGKPLLFIGHLDVVEVDPRAWSSDPFRLVERGGYFYGRGTEDMKGEDAVLLTALIRLKQENFLPDRDIIAAFTADEEAGGDANGVKYLFAAHRNLVDSDMVLNVDDSGGRLREGKRVYIGVETSEKLYATYEFSTADRGGHSSLPRPDNAIYELTAALQKLAAYTFPARSTATTRAYFAALANLRQGQESEDMKAVAQAVPDRAAAARLSRDPEWNALLRTTCVATMIDGGQGESALPNRAHATIQCRLLPGETPEQTRATLTRVVGDPGVKIATDLPIDPSPETPPTQAILARYKQAADAVWPNSVVIPEMAAGASDSVYARLAGLPSYLSSTIFIEDSRAHARDERVLVQAFDEAGEYAYHLLKVMSAR
jgi:acetylornithine deacetylase/succinyl-diaminopimelate desuccinylase-like protein